MTTLKELLYHNAKLKFFCENLQLSDLWDEFLEVNTREAMSEISTDFKDLGKIYSYGRGGATLAPEKFVVSSGSGFYFNDEPVSDRLIELNIVVREFCSRNNLKTLWQQFCEFEISQVEEQVKELVDTKINILNERENLDPLQFPNTELLVSEKLKDLDIEISKGNAIINNLNLEIRK